MNWNQLQRMVTVAVGLVFMVGATGSIEAKRIATTQIIGEGMVTNSTIPFLNLSERESFAEPLQVAQQQQSRVALVIGNANYEGAPLANTINDATAIHRTLNELGFDVLPLVTNANQREMVAAIGAFQERLEAGAVGVGVFYYAGHGVQVNGSNYLVPIGANLEREADAEFDAINLDRVIRAMDSADTAFNILIIDACRDNPFYRRWRRTRGSTTRGLTVNAPPRGTLIAYATEPNDVAEDGSNGSRHSPYTQSLLTHLRTPGISILDMLTRVTADVLEATDEQQSPYFEGNPIGFFSFNPAIAVTSEPIAPNPSDLANLSPPTPVPVEPVQPHQSSRESLINEVVRLTNRFRQQNGLLVLTVNANLNWVAQAHSQNMALQDFFDHIGLDGSNPWDRLTAARYRWSRASENIAAGQRTAEEVVTAWMNNPSHRANIMDPNVREIGVGYYELTNDTGNVNYNRYWTQVFGAPQ